jgi:hypothetical protein
MVQLATTKTANLVKALVKWPSVEISLFLSELLKCVPLERSGSVRSLTSSPDADLFVVRATRAAKSCMSNSGSYTCPHYHLEIPTMPIRS